MNPSADGPGEDALSPTDVGLFATVATVIPVFFVAYAVGDDRAVEGLARRFGQTLAREFAGRPLMQTLLFLYALGFALVVGTAVPIWGESMALLALYLDRPPGLTHVGAPVGVLTTGFVVLVPLIITTFRGSYLVGYENGVARAEAELAANSCELAEN